MALTAAISLLLLLFAVPAFSSRTSILYITDTDSSSGEVVVDANIKYHKGPVLSSPITVNIIWYGEWNTTLKCVIRDFLRSISSAAAVEPSVLSWWKTPRLYYGEKNANVTDTVLLGNETDVAKLSPNATRLTRESIESVVRSKVSSPSSSSITDGSSVYLLLTSHGVTFPGFCDHSCGSHSYLDLSEKKQHRKRVPYAWIGNSGRACPGMCAFPFSTKDIPGAPNGTKTNVVKPPNEDVGIDGMVVMLAHEISGMVTNPFANGWFAGGTGPKDPTRREIAYICEGVFGRGGGGGYPGNLTVDEKTGGSYNAIGFGDRKFVLPWLWDMYLKKCDGPNNKI